MVHLAIPRKKISKIREALAKVSDESLHERVRDDLASSVAVYPPEGPQSGDGASAEPAD